MLLGLLSMDKIKKSILVWCVVPYFYSLVSSDLLLLDDVSRDHPPVGFADITCLLSQIRKRKQFQSSVASVHWLRRTSRSRRNSVCWRWSIRQCLHWQTACSSTVSSRFAELKPEGLLKVSVLVGFVRSNQVRRSLQ